MEHVLHWINGVLFMPGIKKIPIEINGVKYESVADACRAYKTPKNRYKHRIRSGWDRIKAITAPADQSKVRQTK